MNLKRPNVVYTSINIRKIKFIAYIYICVNQTLDEKSYISAKIKAVKHLHAVFLLNEEQCRRPISIKSKFIMTSLMSRGSMVLWNVNYITFQWFTKEHFNKYITNINILIYNFFL